MLTYQVKIKHADYDFYDYEFIQSINKFYFQFNKFKKIEDIPLDFVRKGIKLRGKIRSVHSLNINKYPMNSTLCVKENILRENVPFSSNSWKLLQNHVNANFQENSTIPLYALVSISLLIPKK